jgi:2-oxoisovalerate dehydrogenase E1 component alpha subunit
MIRTFVVARRTAGNALHRRGFSTTRLARNNLPTTNSPIVNRLNFFNSVTGSSTQIPTYRVLDGVGQPIEGAELPEVCFSSGFLYSLKLSV